MRSYAIGDIHGQIDRLREAHRRIAEDRHLTGDDQAPVVHLGDLVDRGPDSAGVIALLSEGIAAGQPWQVVKGNHDRLFTGFIADPLWHDPGFSADLDWLNPRLGGNTTLASYGVDVAGRALAEIHAEALVRVPAAHLAFLTAQPCWIQRGEATFVHAGIRPGIAMEAQVEQDLLWIRAGFLEDTRSHGTLIVHGHTALPAARHYGNRLNLDSGAGYGRELSVAVIEGRSAALLTEDGRVPLEPFDGE